MKKVIPQKIANKVYSKLLSKNQNRVEGEYPEDILFKPGTNELNHRYFKNNVGNFIYKCKYVWSKYNWWEWKEKETVSTRRKLEKLQCDLNDYLQER
jgi:hypothetical protein